MIASMFCLFKKRTEAEKLNRKYQKLLHEASLTSKINRMEADKLYAKADEVLKEINTLSVNN